MVGERECDHLELGCTLDKAAKRRGTVHEAELRMHVQMHESLRHPGRPLVLDADEQPRVARAVVREVVDPSTRQHPPESPRNPSARVPPSALGRPHLHDRIDAVGTRPLARTRTGAGAMRPRRRRRVSSACLAAQEPSLRDRSDARTIHGLARSSTITGKPAALAFEQLEWLALGRCGESFDGCVAAHALSRLPGRIEQSRRGHRRTFSIRTYVRFDKLQGGSDTPTGAFLGGCLYGFHGHETRDITRDCGANTSDIDRESVRRTEHARQR